MLDDALLFVQVVQARSFSKAAASLGISKSQLSRNISRLEKKLDSQLLIRTTRHLSLTDAGKDFFSSCQQIQQIYLQALEQLNTHKNKLAGKIRITAPSTIGKHFLQPKISTFMSEHPDISIAVDFTDRIIAMPDEKIDISIRLSKSLADSSLYAKKLQTFDYCLCASPQYLETAAELKSPEDLIRHKIIGLKASMLSKWQFADGISLTLNNHLATNDYQSHIDYSLKHLGIINIPKPLVESFLKSGQLITVLTNYPLKQKNLWAIYANKASLPLRVRKFLDYLTPSSKVAS